jgi:hypothetical protein
VSILVLERGGFMPRQKQVIIRKDEVRMWSGAEWMRGVVVREDKALNR